MTQSTSMFRAVLGAAALTMSLGACGGVVSLGDPGNDKDRLGGSGSDTGGPPASDTGTTPPVDDGGIVTDAGAEWPSTTAWVDGSVPDSGLGGFTELIWQRWWSCPTGICTQEFWINAECHTFYDDRGSISEGNLDTTSCNQLMTAVAEMNLASALQDPIPCPRGPNGSKAYELHLDGHMGPKYRKHVDSCDYAGGLAPSGIGNIEKLIANALRSMPGAVVADFHPQMS